MLFSHKGRDLMSHLEGVGRNLEYLGAEYAHILGITHDVAKAHPIFQEKLKKGSGPSFSHALPSALLTYVMLVDEGETPETALLYAEAVRNHHSGMKSVPDIEAFWEDEDVIDRYLETLLDIEPFIKEHVYRYFSGGRMWQYLETVPMFGVFPDKGDIPSNLDTYFRMRNTLSLLVAADRVDAVFGGSARVLKNLTRRDAEEANARIKMFLSSVDITPINRWRMEIRNDILSEYKSRMVKRGVVRLTLPTGAGKTLISLSMALDNVLFYGAKRIIYVLPFISTGEQVASVMENMFGEDMVMTDNYLSGAKGETSELSPYDIVSTIMRYWIKPVVVTTGVYMWDVLFGRSAMDTMNFHLLKDAAIIFDEVQSIPTEFWGDLATVAEYLGKHNLVILMSATHPIDVKESITLTTHKRLPKSRYTARVIQMGDSEMLPLDDAIKNKQSILIILNTRDSARQFFWDLISRYPEMEDHMYFLSTYVIPKHRREVINTIRERERQHLPRILVSTQVVEAGVDLSFEVLYRELAPIDSIIQSAGRCGRHGEVLGDVSIIIPSKSIGRVYGSIKKEITEGIISDAIRGGIFPCPEERLSTLEKEYFDRLKEQKDIYKIIKMNISQGDYGMSAYNPSLIKNPIPTVSYVIPVEDEVWDMIYAIRELEHARGDKFTTLNRRKILMSKLSAYIINVPASVSSGVDKNDVQSLFASSDSILILEKDKWKKYYDTTVGWTFKVI